MLRLGVIVLFAMNVAALFAGLTPFFVTFADIPVKEIPQIHNSAELAAALGHARLNGMEEMRSFLFSGALCLAGIMLINLVAAFVALRMKRATQPNHSLKADHPDGRRP